MLNCMNTEIILANSCPPGYINNMINIRSNFRAVFKIKAFKSYPKIFFCRFKGGNGLYTCMQTNPLNADFFFNCLLFIKLIIIYQFMI